MTAGRAPGKDDRLYRSEAVPAEPANSTVVDYLGHPDKLRGQRGGASERQAPPPVVPTILCVPGSWRRDQRRASRNKRPTHGPALRSAVTKTSPSCSAFGAFRIAAAEKSSKAGSAAAGLRSRRVVRGGNHGTVSPFWPPRTQCRGRPRSRRDRWN